MFSSDGLNNTLFSQGCVLQIAPTVGTVGRVYIPRTGVRVRSLQFLGSAGGSADSYDLLQSSTACDWLLQFSPPLLLQGQKCA